MKLEIFRGALALVIILIWVALFLLRKGAPFRDVLLTLPATLYFEYNFISYFVLISIISIWGVLNYKWLSTPYRYLLILLAVTLFTETFGRVFGAQLETNIPLFHLFVPIEYALLTLIYFNLTGQKPLYRVYAIASVSLVAVFSIVNAFYFQGLKLLPSNLFLMYSILLIFQVLMLFRYMLQNPDSKAVFLQSMFWFNSANLLFHSLTFLVWGIFNPLLGSSFLKEVLPILYFANIVQYILYFTALIAEKRNHRYGGSDHQ